MSFVYKERSMDAIKKRINQKGSNRDGFLKSDFPTFSPKVGESNRIRILPPTWENPDHYGLDLYVHYNIGGDNSAYLCLKKMKSEKCPICTSIAEIGKDDKDFTNKVRDKRKVLVWIIDRKDEDAGPKLWAMPFSKVDNEIILQANDEELGSVLRVDHPTEGYDVSFSVVKGLGDGIPFTYEGVKISRHQSPIFADKNRMNKVLNFISENPLPSVLVFKPYDYIRKQFNAENDSTDNGNEPTVVDETPIAYKEEVLEEEPWTWESLKAMPIEDLRTVAMEYADFAEDDIVDFAEDEDGLRKELAKALGVEIPRPKKIEVEKKDNSALRNIQQKYGTKRV